MWKRLHWTTRRDLKLVFWVMLFAAPVLVYVLWDDIGGGVRDGSTTFASSPGDAPREWRKIR